MKIYFTFSAIAPKSGRLVVCLSYIMVIAYGCFIIYKVLSPQIIQHYLLIPAIIIYFVIQSTFKMRLKFNEFYFLLAVLLFTTEVLIALFLDDAIIRPFGGDFLVVILIYCFVKAFLNTPFLPTAAGVLLFAYAIEVAQYFNAVQLLGLSHNKTASTVMGTSFSFTDLLMYTLGITFVILIETIYHKKQNPTL